MEGTGGKELGSKVRPNVEYTIWSESDLLKKRAICIPERRRWPFLPLPNQVKWRIELSDVDTVFRKISERETIVCNESTLKLLYQEDSSKSPRNTINLMCTV